MATKRKVDQTEIFAFVDRTRGNSVSDEGAITIDFMIRETHNGQDDFYRVTDSTYRIEEYGGLFLHDLKIRGYVETKEGIPTVSTFYITPIYLDVYKVELDTARAMAHTLTTIHTRMAKYAEDWGHAQTFGQGVLYALKAVGVKRIVCRNSAHAFDVTGDRYQMRSVADVSDMIYGLLNPPTIIKIADAPPIVPQVIES